MGSAETVDWLDGVKGACMVLVVFFHVSLWYASAPIGQTAWFDVSVTLTPLRMPTFFLVSGILAQHAIDHDWAKARRRSLNLYVVYLLWTTLFSLRLFVPAARDDDPAPTLELLGANAILPTYYWYIWALPAYYLLSVGARRLLGRASPWLIVPAALISFFALELDNLFSRLYPPVLELAWTAATMQNFLWFYIGIVAKTWIVGTLERTRRRTMVLALVAALAFVIVVRLLPAGTTTSLVVVGGSERFMQMVQTPGYVVMMLSIFVLLRATWFTRFFNWIGRGTLSVYILHLWLIIAMTAVLLVVPPPQLPPWLGWIVPIVLTLAISVVSRLIGRLITKSPFRWMLNGPLPLAQRRRARGGSDRGDPTGG